MLFEERGQVRSARQCARENVRTIWPRLVQSIRKGAAGSEELVRQAVAIDVDECKRALGGRVREAYLETERSLLERRRRIETEIEMSAEARARCAIDDRGFTGAE